jgi:hypothetical protein
MANMFIKPLAGIFLLSYMSSARAMEEDLTDVPSPYLTILQKAYQGDPKSIDGLHNALRKLKERLHPDDYKKELNQLHNEALSQEISSETFAKHIKNFVEHEKHKICASPLTDFDDNFHQTLWTSLTAEERQKIQRMREAAQGQ